MEPIFDSKGLNRKGTNSQELRAFPAPFGSFFNSSCIVVPQPVTGVHLAKDRRREGRRSPNPESASPRRAIAGPSATKYKYEGIAELTGKLRETGTSD